MTGLGKTPIIKVMCRWETSGSSPSSGGRAATAATIVWFMCFVWSPHGSALVARGGKCGV